MRISATSFDDDAEEVALIFNAASRESYCEVAFPRAAPVNLGCWQKNHWHGLAAGTMVVGPGRHDLALELADGKVHGFADGREVFNAEAPPLQPGGWGVGVQNGRARFRDVTVR
jgi:hypothetical protein